MSEQGKIAQGRSRFIDGAAGKIHIRDFGGAGPVIVALHGVTGGTFLWDGVATALQGQARLVAMDFRGHGQSDWSADRSYTTDAYAQDLESVLAALEIKTPPILMGSSWGALAMIRVAARHPNAAAALIIVDVEPSFAASATDVFPRPYKFPNLDAVVAWERKANPAAPDAALESFASGSVTHMVEGDVLRRHDPFFLTNWPFRNDDLWAEVAAVTQPALVLNGDRTFVRREVCEKMAEAFPRGSFAGVENSGHLVPLEQPDRLAALAMEFIAAST